MKDKLTAFLLVGLLVVVVGQAQEAGELPRPGLWSAHATRLEYSPGTAEKPGIRALRIPSPDKKLVLVVRDNLITVERGGGRLHGTEGVRLHPLAEMAWAPDAKAFFITQSDGGNVGTWTLDVYLIDGNQVRQVDVIHEVKLEFSKHYRCSELTNPTATEEPNIAALAWLHDSSNLLVVAEVPPHSSCPEMGKLGGYIVAVPSGRILQDMDEKSLRASWTRTLGERLLMKQ